MEMARFTLYTVADKIKIGEKVSDPSLVYHSSVSPLEYTLYRASGYLLDCNPEHTVIQTHILGYTLRAADGAGFLRSAVYLLS